MANITKIIDVELVQPTTNENPLLVLDKPLLVSDTEIVFNFEPKDSEGNSITKPVFIGIVSENGYVENIFIPANGISGAVASGVTRGVKLGGLDFVSDSDLIVEHRAGESVIFINSSQIIQMLYSSILGDIATGGNIFKIGDETDQDYVFGYRDSAGDKGLVRINTATSKAQYSNDGTTWIDIDTPAPANVTTRVTTPASANAGELFQNSSDNNSLYFKDNGGFSLKLYDDTSQVIPKASIEFLKDITSSSTEVNQLTGTTNIQEANTFFGATDITGAEAEMLSDGSNASALHGHGLNIYTAQYTGTLGTSGSTTVVVPHGLTYTPTWCKVIMYAVAADDQFFPYVKVEGKTDGTKKYGDSLYMVGAVSYTKMRTQIQTTHVLKYYFDANAGPTRDNALYVDSVSFDSTNITLNITYQIASTAGNVFDFILEVGR